MRNPLAGSRKIGVIHVTFDMRIGGAEQVIRTLVENTDSSRYNVSLVCLNRPLGPFGCDLQRRGFHVEIFDRKPGFDLALVGKIREVIVSRGIDVVHCHQYTPYVYGLLGSLGTRAGVIFTEHGRFHPDPPRLKRVLLNPFFSLLTRHVTAISSATRDALIRVENFPSERVGVIYNGIDDKRFRLPRDSDDRASLGIPRDVPVLGTVARLDGIKNQAVMIRALRLLRETHPDVRLLIVGDGPERENLERLAEDLQVNSRVIFTGFREDTHRCYRVMDIFLLTSFTEGTAMTLLEAMASGLPCIATDVGGNGEIVRDEETGLLVASNDDVDLAEAIERLLADEALRLKMGAAGRGRFEECFTVEKMAQGYQALYDQEFSPGSRCLPGFQKISRTFVPFSQVFAGLRMACRLAGKTGMRPSAYGS